MTKKENSRNTSLTIAYLVSEMKMTQQQAATHLGLNQSAVSRHLKKVKAYLVAQPPYRFNRNMVDDSTMSAILANAAVQQLAPLLDKFSQDRGQPRGPVLHVLQVPRPEGADTMRSFTAFAEQAAPIVRSLLMRDVVNTCGLTWGFMLWELARGTRALGIQQPWRPKKPIRFIPLTGDPLQDRKAYPPSLTSSNIAAEMSQIANGDEYRPPWLGLVPAYVPDKFKDAALKGIEGLIQMVPEYGEIFGAKGRLGLAFELDAILTSVGPAVNPLGFGMGRLLANLGTSRVKQLREEIYGDIGGVLLPRNRTPPSALVKGIERRWKGLKGEHLEACARRAAADDPSVGCPGVIVLALGDDRAEVVLHAIERGLISHLILDQQLEKSLERLVVTVQRAAPG